LIINDTLINASCEDVVYELQRQLHINNIPYLHYVKDSGKDLMITCPYHGNGQERRPSAGIRKSDGMFHCFACGEVHTLSEVISHCFNTSDLFGAWGMKWIIKNFATIEVEDRKDVEIDMERNNITNKNNILDNSINNKSKWVSEEELDSYRYYHEYWTERGITADWLIELFDLGWDVKTDCITFPVRDIHGNCLFVARRSIKTKWFNYPRLAHKPVYGLYELCRYANKMADTSLNEFLVRHDLYVTESMIDCLRFWQNDKFAVALNGLGSKEQFIELKEHTTKEL
jgi:hypothetical protein